MYALIDQNKHVYLFTKKSKYARKWLEENPQPVECRIARVFVYDYVYHRFAEKWHGVKIPRELELDKVGIIVLGPPDRSGKNIPE